MPKISVIIPVYNVEKYLDKCICSVINQTFTNLEIICVNDGSTDNSLKILKSYAQKDNRIKLIDITNHGVSYARNLGLTNATGDYVIFIDSDDYVSSSMCQDFIQNALETGSDLVCCGRKIETYGGAVRKIWLPKKSISKAPISDYKYFTHYRTVTSKLFKRYIIEGNNLRFDLNFNYGEDCIFLIEYLTHCNFITGIKKINYNVVINQKSLSRNVKYKETRKVYRRNFEIKINSIIQSFLIQNSGQKTKNFIKENNMNTEKLDFVYLLKPGDPGTDLRYSLRSIAKWYPNNRVWLVGYKPAWVQNVNYLPINEDNNKWKNLVNDLMQACKCEDISEDFIYMNDDFFAINPKIPLEEVIDSHIGLLDERIRIHKKSKKTKTKWQNAFEQVGELLKKIGVDSQYYNYEAHLPLRINKTKFLEVMSLPEVQEFIKTPNVLHYRTLYKNYDRPDRILKIRSDVKVLGANDTTAQKMDICGWLSTADGLVGNSKFYNLNRTLQTNLGAACIYEGGCKHKTQTNKKTTNLPYKTNRYF